MACITIILLTAVALVLLLIYFCTVRIAQPKYFGSAVLYEGKVPATSTAVYRSRQCYDSIIANIGAVTGKNRCCFPKQGAKAVLNCWQ